MNKSTIIVIVVILVVIFLIYANNKKTKNKYTLDTRTCKLDLEEGYVDRQKLIGANITKAMEYVQRYGKCLYFGVPTGNIPNFYIPVDVENDVIKRVY